MWHEFRIIDDMYQRWKAKKEEAGYNGTGESGMGESEPEMKADGTWQKPPPLRGGNRLRNAGTGPET